MKNNLHYSPDALNDLDEIWEYISFDACSISVAEKTVGRITAAIDQLEDFSQLGTLLSTKAEIQSNYRFLAAGNYMVFYRAVKNEVYIDRILHCKRSYLRILFSDQEPTD